MYGVQQVQAEVLVGKWSRRTLGGGERVNSYSAMRRQLGTVLGQVLTISYVVLLSCPAMVFVDAGEAIS